MKEPFRSKNVRLAYMQVEKDDKPAYQVDLVFRIKSLRKNIQKKVDSILVCPPENGVSSKVTCESCGWCWKPLAQDVNIKETKRVPLLVVK